MSVSSPSPLSRVFSSSFALRRAARSAIDLTDLESPVRETYLSRNCSVEDIDSLIELKPVRAIEDERMIYCAKEAMSYVWDLFDRSDRFEEDTQSDGKFSPLSASRYNQNPWMILSENDIPKIYEKEQQLKSAISLIKTSLLEMSSATSNDKNEERKELLPKLQSALDYLKSIISKIPKKLEKNHFDYMKACEEASLDHSPLPPYFDGDESFRSLVGSALEIWNCNKEYIARLKESPFKERSPLDQSKQKELSGILLAIHEKNAASPTLMKDCKDEGVIQKLRELGSLLQLDVQESPTKPESVDTKKSRSYPVC